MACRRRSLSRGQVIPGPEGPSSRLGPSCRPPSRATFLDWGRTCPELILSRRLANVPRFTFGRALPTDENLAAFEDLDLPAGAGARVIAQLAGPSVGIAQAPGFLARLRLPGRGFRG